ncbi:YdcF family protein [Paenibacillus radicis (ex Xue et al. 2023)]|uniref:YdcF family protein n=1 Tax=Paenibacillus radicis (ex Xue et al. 2023) TaxID=2972489 RepID=A0ABT1YUU5_9BACL|nr:YdcF family protein [Paenibacillus radicis (ex Xue et al. 2023)]MCR8636719.1 YdcF family protein [Paenibacillus radicis (ex Xue et al. 2023)]
MLYIIKYIYTFFIPPGLFITVLVLFNLWLRKRERSAAKLLWAVIAFIYLICTPIIGNTLIGYLEHRYEPPVTIEGDVIVLLTGGAVGNTPDVGGSGNLTGYTMNRLVTAYKLHKSTNLPIIISGGQVYEDTGNEGQICKRNLLALGVAESSIWLDDRSRNTKENALNTIEIMKQKNFTKPVLVTSAFHIPRSVENFKQLGVLTAPYPADFLVPQPYSITLSAFLPSADGLQKSSLAAKEYLGLLELLVH